MKPAALLLVLCTVAVLLASGCLDNTPIKKESVPVTTPATSVPVVTPAVIPRTPMVTYLPPDTLVTTTPDTAPVILTYEVPTEPDQVSLRVLKYHEERPVVGELIIVGTAKNDGKIFVPKADVQIKFYDADRKLIGSAKDTVENFDPGESWTFSIAYPGDDSAKVKSYKVSIIEVTS